MMHCSRIYYFIMIALLFVVLRRFIDVRQGRSNMAELKQVVLLKLKALGVGVYH